MASCQQTGIISPNWWRRELTAPSYHDPHRQGRQQGGATKAFFDKWNSYGIAYDVIGQSYYPWWHGTLLDLRENLYFMAKEYQKDIIIVEAAYNYRPAEYRERPAPFPETPEGQRQFWDEVHQAILETPDNRGKGIFWWEPATGPRRSSRGMFDNEGNALPVVTVFDRFTRN